MATKVAAGAISEPDQAGLRLGVIDRLTDLPDRLPGPGVAWYVVLGAVLIVSTEVAGWLTGARPLGRFEPALATPAVILTYLLAARHILRELARKSYEAFLPAIGNQHVERSLQLSLFSTPDRLAIPIVVGFEVLISGSWALDPTIGDFIPGPVIDGALTWALWLAAVAASALLLLLTIRQVIAVVRLHELASSIDLFRPAAINAFSRLTVTMALFLVPLIGFAALSSNSSAQVPIFGALAIGCFVLPLRGMHDRLVSEKARLTEDVNLRLVSVRARLHAAVDADDLERVGKLGSAQQAVLADRDLVARLSTWPWTTAVFRGFASAVVVPIVLWLLFRILERVI